MKPTRWRDLNAKRVAVWGLGENCEAFLRRRRRDDADRPIDLLDEAPPNAEQRRRLRSEHGALNFVEAADIAEALDRAEILVKAPGVGLYHPLLSDRPDLVVTSVTALQLAEPEFREKCVAVTGTKGKTTIASLVHHCLRALGADATLGGNAGAPASDLPDAQHHILEMSSFMIADLDAALTPPRALLSNLHPAHIDWHGDLERYYDDKLRLFQTPQTVQRFNAACPNTRGELERRGIRPDADAWYMSEDGFHADDEGRVLHKKRAVGEAPPVLAGEHNRHNLCAALSLCACLGHDPDAALAAAADYAPPPHRHQRLGVRDGVRYIDNGIATVPEATLAALQRCREEGDADITLLLGGAAQRRDLGRFAQALKRVAKLRIVIMPDAAEDIPEALNQTQIDFQRGADIDETVRIARDITPENGVILLSPAAPTGQGHFRNYLDRARAFRQAAGF